MGTLGLLGTRLSRLAIDLSFPDRRSGVADVIAWLYQIETARRLLDVCDHAMHGRDEPYVRSDH